MATPNQNLNSKIYLVTGGTGFLGVHLIKLLVSNGAIVRALVRTENCEVSNFLKELGVQFYNGSILDQIALSRASEGVDGIFHLAGLVVHSRNTVSAQAMRETNVNGTINIMRAAAIAKCRVIFASSSGTVGCSLNKNFIGTDDSPYCNEIVKNWPYYVSKIEAETKAKEIAAKENVELVIMRPSMLLGPGDVRFRSTQLILSFVDRKIPFIPSGGISFVDVRDAATCFLRAMIKQGENNPSGKSFLLASCNLSLYEFFELLEKVSGVKKPKFRNISPTIVKIGAKAIGITDKIRGLAQDPNLDPVKAEMATHFWSVDSNLSREFFSFEPIDPMRTLADTVNWIFNNRDIYGRSRLLPDQQPKLSNRLYSKL
eukprot:TRINITY_DN420_c2_g1_i1.p1 TRINITY_DN420_c2_g1~~TRINITY_DN420_c2_g1_i1.p1  ORF type:complete len:372 (+),score=177.38 TRINITY_DN420_c2_g1_i1:79-1194(+)